MPRIHITTFLDSIASTPLYDARSPSEYEQGHIPGARSMPLFSDEERAIVGTTYKKRGPEKALEEGLEIVGPKMRSFVERVKKETGPDKQLALHCWRGGKRSDSLAWLLQFAGFKVKVLEGGYKAYRRHLLDWFENTPLNLIVLGGYTGSGKTDVLYALREKGAQMIDLEGLASHRGSAFGSLGQEEQPRSEQFENDLFEAFMQLDPKEPIWLENESRAIGKVFIPEGLWRQMKAATLIHMDLPLESRIKRLHKEYAGFPIDQLQESFDRIQRRLGGQHHKAALEALDQGNIEDALRIALKYYDKAYSHKGMHPRQESAPFIQLNIEKDDPKTTAKTLLKTSLRP